MDFDRVFTGVFKFIGMLFSFLLFLLAVVLGLVAILAGLMMWATPDQLTAIKSGVGSIQLLILAGVAFKLSNMIMNAASAPKE